MTDVERDKRVVGECFDAFAKGDAARWAAKVSESFRRHGPGPFRLEGGKLAEPGAMVDAPGLLRQRGATSI